MKSIPEFDNYYVSEDGRIWSDYKGKKKLLKQSKSKKGYMRVNLYLNKKNYNRRVHRLVAQVFIPNPENKPEVNHKNGNTVDNHSRNLEWVTTLENQAHRKTIPRKKRYYLTEKQYYEYQDLKRKFG
jgi:hypothetical protein